MVTNSSTGLDNYCYTKTCFVAHVNQVHHMWKNNNNRNITLDILTINEEFRL